MQRETGQDATRRYQETVGITIRCQGERRQDAGVAVIPF